MGKMNEYSQRENEIRTEVAFELGEKHRDSEIALHEKITELLTENSTLKTRLNEVLKEIQMGVSQVENDVNLGFSPQTEMFKDVNEWIEAGLERLAR